MNGTEAPSPATTGDPILDRAGDLIKMGAKCSEEILANPHLLEEWVEEASRDPSIRAREEEVQDMARQDMITPALKSYDRSDLGNSERFVRRYGQNIRYCHPQKTWYIWDRTRWKRDEEGRIQDLAKRAVRYIGDEAGLIDGETERAAMWKWAAASQNHSRISGLISLAQSAVPILPEHLDSNKDLLNCLNGTLDLSSLVFRDHVREDLCSMITGVRYDPAARCPLWEDHLDLIFGGDAAFIRDFQMMAGYSLLADNPEQVFFILYGSGKNGKSVTVTTLAAVLGEYSTNMAAESLMIRKNSDAPRSDIVKLVGARLITASESDASHRLSESLIKSLTGGDTITARSLYQTEREYKISGKIWFSTNHRPVIKGTDAAIWRRVWLVPFEVTIPDERRDRLILEKLAAEGSGILNWMIEGLKRYRENGDRLQMPERVALANQAYRIDSDVIGQFLLDRYILDPSAMISRATLYEQYVTWCKETGEDSTSARTFAIRIQERGISSKKIHGTRYWSGIREKTHDEIKMDTQSTLLEEGDLVSRGTKGQKGTNFQEIPHEKLIEKSPGKPSSSAPCAPTDSIPTTRDEAMDLLLSVNGDPSHLSPGQQAAIKTLWPARRDAS